MEELTDNDIHISPLTIISNRYGGGFLAFNLESWDVPKEINDDGLDFISFWHHDAQKYIIGKGDTPQEAMDNLKAKLNPAPDNPLIDKFLFLDFEGIANLGDQDFRENLQFIVEQTHCKIIITSLCRLDGPETVHEKWKELQMPVEYYSMTPVMSGFLQDPNNHLAENIELSKRYKALEINEMIGAGWAGLGYVYSDRGDSRKAIRCFKKALELEPWETDHLYSLATDYMKLKEYDTAMDCLRKIQEQTPNDADAYYYIADLYGQQDKIDEAINTIKFGLLQTDNDSSLLYLLAYAYFVKGSHGEGLGALDEALSADFEAWPEFLEFDKELLSNDAAILDLIAQHKNKQQ